MIDLAKEIDNKMLSESRKPKHIFNNDTMTFKDLKDLFTNVFNSNIVSVSRRVPMTAMYVTHKDGEFYVASCDTPQKLLKVNAVKNGMKLDESDAKPVESTLSTVLEALGTIDPVLLNRYFANGKNMLKCSLVCPPKDCSSLYGDKCFIQLDGVDCFDGDCKCIGQDQKTGAELCKILKGIGSLDSQLASMNAEQLAALRKCKAEKKVLAAALEQLQKLVDGIGWGCSIKYYIQDKYSRSIVNKALEHGLDVSKNGAFVDELVSRLSGTSCSRPTKSDLVTFAKREGIDCGSQQYKDFLEDIENTADETSREVIAPIENLVYYALSKAANNVIAAMSLDPNPKAKKMLSQIACGLFSTCDQIDECGFDVEQLVDLKKALQKVCKYKEIVPTEIRVMNAGKPYAVTVDVGKLEQLCEVAN